MFSVQCPERKYSDFRQIVMGVTFLDMLTLKLMPQLQDDIDIFILQLDFMPPHWSVYVRDFNGHFPHRWIKLQHATLPMGTQKSLAISSCGGM
ncbi:hypothetical protein TNCV_161482 [Trichonephila clavipes]|nr:hypothetical protein TNCV_161482 [Trichonephila clavipes]